MCARPTPCGLPHGDLLPDFVSTHLRDQLQAALGGGYSVAHELGGGGMSHVFVAEDAALGRRVVVKVLPPDAAAGISTERFHREIALAARLQHPHIVPLLSAGEIVRHDAPGVPLPYFTMPLVEGESLRQRLAKGGELPIAEGLRLLREVASALDYAHEKGIVHRDIKPDNILLSRGSAMVTDFGVAKALSASNDPNAPSMTSLGIALGTPAYMAPEQAAASPNVDARADVYALGVTAYELFTGRPPFLGRSPQATLAAHISEPPEPIGNLRASVPTAVASLIMRCLEKNPADRPQTAAEIVRQLDSITTPGVTAPMPDVGPSTRRGPRRRWLFIAAGVAVIGAAIVFALRGRGGTSGTTGEVAASVAVLPFENGSGDTTSNYLADGIADELRSGLTKLGSVRVKSRSASMRFRGTHTDARTVGAKLDVSRILQGTVSKVGSRLHVTADLVNVTSDDAVWSATFDRPQADLGGIQDSIAQGVASALHTPNDHRAQEISGARDRGTSDPVAYESFLKARATDDAARAILYLKDAVSRDPRFGRAYAALSRLYAGLPIAGLRSRDSALALAKANLRKAEAIDSTLIEVYEAQAEIATVNVEYVAAAAALSKAVSMDPTDPDLILAYANALANLGRVDEALAEMRRARAADPLSLDVLINDQYFLLLAHRFRDALDLFRTIAAVDSANTPALENAGEAYIFLGRPDSALGFLKRAFAAGGVTYGGRGALVTGYAALGQWAELDRQRELARHDPPINSPLTAKAFDQVLMGNLDTAMTALERGAIEREPTLASISIACEPLLDPLKANPRFGSLMQKLGARACPAVERWPFPKRPK